MAPGDAGDRRIDGVDVVRCLALFSMYVAHTAPGEGPGRVFELSEYLTAALFALLVGVGTELGRRSHRDVLRDFWSSGVRAVALVLIGRALMTAGTSVVIVLVHLGALTLILALLARMRSSVLAGLALIAYAVAPWLKVELAPAVPSDSAGLTSELMDYLLTGEPYRVSTFMVFGLVGILATRWLVPLDTDGPVAWRGWSLGTASLLGAGAVFGLEAAGLLVMKPYEGKPGEVLFSTLLALGVLGIALAGAGRLPAAVRGLLARTGAITLTLYAMHILWLATYARALPYSDPYGSWFNFAGLTLGSLLMAEAWGHIDRRTVLGRGPLEGLVSQAARPWFLRGRGDRRLGTEVR